MTAGVAGTASSASGVWLYPPVRGRGGPRGKPCVFPKTHVRWEERPGATPSRPRQEMFSFFAFFARGENAKFQKTPLFLANRMRSAKRVLRLFFLRSVTRLKTQSFSWVRGVTFFTFHVRVPLGPLCGQIVWIARFAFFKNFLHNP